MKDNMDILLEKALKPDIEPDMELNEKILNGVKHKKKSLSYKLARVAAVVCGIALVSPVAIYAANAIKNSKVEVSDHGISVGGQGDYAISDEDLAQPWEDVETEEIEFVEGDETVKWLTKRVEVVSGTYTNTYYAYDNYLDAITDAGLDNWFNTTYEMNESVTYIHTDGGDFQDFCVDASLKYNDGNFFVSESKMTGNVAEDASFGLCLTNTGNERTYTSSQGLEFTLVDEVKDGETTTYVIIYYDYYRGYISFSNLSEEEIHQVLDTVNVSVVVKEPEATEEVESTEEVIETTEEPITEEVTETTEEPTTEEVTEATEEPTTEATTEATEEVTE